MALLDWSVPVSSLVNKLQENGYKIFSVDDVIIDQNLSDTTARKKAVDEIVSVNDSAVALFKDKKTFAVYIVLGNDPNEIAADYTDNEDLERVIDSYNEQWEGKKCPTIKE
jgi:methionine synthase II (cobalamin-independent)